LNEPNTLRISLDTKAKVKVCEFSRGGSARTVEPIRALDHDIRPDALLVPFGILELTRGVQEIHQPWIAFGQSGNRTGLSAAVPQQIQSDRTLLGSARTTLEWHAFDECRDCSELDSDGHMAWRFTDRPSNLRTL
jgi:hypothetical protein